MLRHAVRFLRLPGARKALVLRAVPLLVLARTALQRIGLARARRVTTRAAVLFGSAYRTRDMDEVRWAVAAAARGLGWDDVCLPRALTVEAMLGNQRLGHTIVVGFRRADDGRLEGHAWNEVDGTATVDAGEGGSYPARLRLAAEAAARSDPL